MPKWLVALDCQTYGIANSLQLLGATLDVETLSLWEFRRDIAQANAKMAESDVVLMSRDVRASSGIDFSAVKNLIIVPQLTFGGYHPDVAPLFDELGNQIQGVLADYHSLIAVAAFAKGMSVRDAVGLYHGGIYERLGYLSCWEHEQSACIGNFRSDGIDISQDFRGWGRMEPFMYSPNHPRIVCLGSIARIILRDHGVDIEDPGFLPDDNLVSGPIFPVFPEIAEATGVRGGGMRFKAASSFRTLSLEEYVTTSFDLYARLTASGRTLTARPEHRYERALSVI